MKYELLSKQESNNMAAEKKRCNDKFLWKVLSSRYQMLQKHSLKKVLTTTYTLDKKCFANLIKM